jgi:hypothetical protein
MQFDELISSYDQVQKIGHSLAHKFLNAKNTNKVVLNCSDQFATNNNCGFNLANFKPRFVRDYFADVVADYERSFIGSFCTALFSMFSERAADVELYLTITKFNANMGYNLTQNSGESSQD